MRGREVAWFCIVDATDQMKIKKQKNGQNCAKDPQLDKMVFTRFMKERQGSTLINGPVLSIQTQKLPNMIYLLITLVPLMHPKAAYLTFYAAQRSLKQQKLTNFFKTWMLENNLE